jgi:DNA invertase Pin-like site-specific DNA recombinase
VRVSTKEQNEERQVNAMLAVGVSIHNIFIDKATGRTFDRKKYNKLLKILKPGDVLYIESIDRLGRDYDGILAEWNKLTKGKKVIIKVSSKPVLDTDSPCCSLTDKFIRDLTLLSLAYNAEQEYHHIKYRQAQGIAIAKEKGKHLGRPKAPYVLRKRDIVIIEQWKSRKVSEAQAMKLLRKGRTSFYKMVKIYEQKAKDGDKR